ncbi:hypothetical protein B0O99DRAFT_694755 [Bisporella sp. PMI_857]|nr:hypothetical protein B0O99DRAFT_694755 [Bisporella sp. PMI_857]
MIELMQKCAEKNGVIGVNNIHRWPLNSEAKTSAASVAELLKVYYSASLSQSVVAQTASQIISKTVSQPIAHTIAWKDPIYALTAEIPYILPSSPAVDTSEQHSSFMYTIATPVPSSSPATQTSLPLLSVPAVLLLPQLNG